MGRKPFSTEEPFGPDFNKKENNESRKKLCSKKGKSISKK